MIQSTKSGCSVVMLIVIIIIHRVRVEAELEGVYCAPKAPPNTKHTPPHTTSDDDTNAKAPRIRSPWPQFPHNSSPQPHSSPTRSPDWD